MITQVTTQAAVVNSYMRSIAVSSDVLPRSEVKILLAEDQEIVRKGLYRLIDGCPGWNVCGEARNGKEAIEQTLALSPDLVVMDISMPVMSGLEATKQIRRLCPAIKVVMISMYNSMKAAAKEAGADVYVGKCESWRDLRCAIAAVIIK